MSNPTFEIWHRPLHLSASAGSRSLVGINELRVKDSVNVNLDTGYKNSSRTFEFSLANKDGLEAGSFDYGNMVEVKIDGEVVITGVVQKKQTRLAPGINEIFIQGTDYMQNLMETHVNLTIKNGTTNLGTEFGAGSSLPNAGKIVYYVGNQTVAQTGSVLISTDYIDTTNPVTNYGNKFDYLVYNQRRCVDVVSELCSKEYTGNGDYMFYVNNDKYLVYKKKVDASDSPLTLTQDEIKNAEFEKGMFDIKNVITLNAGDNGSGVTQFYTQVNYNSVLQAGWKTGYETRNDIYKNIWKEITGVAEVKTGVASAAQWAQIGSECDKRGNAVAKDLAMRYGSALVKGSVTIRGTKDYTAGNKVTIIGNNFGFLDSAGHQTNQKDLRIAEVEHRLNNNGWLTTLKLIEERLERI